MFENHDHHEGDHHEGMVGVNPLNLLHQCFADLAQATEDFIEDSGDDPRGYMAAVDGLKDSVDAIVTAVFVSMMARTEGLLPIELLEEEIGSERLAELNETDMRQDMDDTRRLLQQTVARAAAAGRL